MKVKPLALIPVAVFAVFAGLALSGMFREDPDALPSAREGQVAPALTLGDLAAKPGFDAEMLSAPGVKLVNFWASWCAPCRVEHPNLEALAAEGLTIYGINYKDDPAKALAFLEELGDPYAGIGTDERGRTALDWGVYGVPETYVIDGEGRVVLRFAGPVTRRALEDRIRPAIEAAATEATARN
ncbi:MAG: DsbE family thiol:disulfide interchange protein [Paracoccaceae bacterium]|nr:DsbE family thiol:disulfide interchange protein [Paracoccaceae bacterium]